MAEILKHLADKDDPVWKLNKEGRDYLDELRERMSIAAYEDLNDAIPRLKSASLENSEIQYKPFEDANIYRYNFPDYYFDKILPATYYLLDFKLAFHYEFRKMLLKYKRIDISDMKGIYALKIDHKDSGKIVHKGLAPIFIRVGTFPPYYIDHVVALLDGGHRLTTGKLAQRATTAIVIEDSKLNPRYPHHKIPHSWHFTKVTSTVPPHAEKAHYVNPDPEYSYKNLLPLAAIFPQSMLGLQNFMWGDVGRPPGTTQ